MSDRGQTTGLAEAPRVAPAAAPVRWPRQDLFRRLRARARIGIWIEGAALLAAAFAVFVSTSYAIDRWLHLEKVFRGAAIAGFVWLSLRIASRALRAPLAVQLDDDELALAVERRQPGLLQSLISAVEFDRDLERRATRGQSESMMRRVLESTVDRLGSLDVIEALDRRRVTRFAALFGVAAAALVGFGLWLPDAALWAKRNLLLIDQPWPRATTLAFDGVDAETTLRIAEREDLTLRVRAAGLVPDEVELIARFAGGERLRRRMDRSGEASFTTTLSTMLEDVEVQARGGDGETMPLRVQIVPRPQLGGLRVTLVLPRYIAAEPRELSELGGLLRIPEGSELIVSATSDKPLRDATIVLDDGQRVPATIAADGRSLTVRFVPQRSGSARLDASDVDDLGPALPPVLQLELAADAPPELDFVTEGIGSMVTANARIPGRLTIRDDFGVDRVEALARTMAAEGDEADAQAEPEFGAALVDWTDPLRAGTTEQVLELVYDLAKGAVDADPDSLRNPVHPGQLLSLRFEATDRRPSPQTGSSEVRTLRVVTREKLMQELRRRQSEQRRELERVLVELVGDRAELGEILSPAGGAAEAPEARLRIETLARRQLARGDTVDAIAGRYRDLLDEFENNRLLEPNVVRSFEVAVSAPLRRAAKEVFPASSLAASSFAESGSEDARAEAVALYDALIATIRRVLAQMADSETLAAIVEDLRIVIRTGREARVLLEKLRDEEGAGIFGSESRRDGEPDKPKDR